MRDKFLSRLGRAAVIALLSATAVFPVWAHDPYEITATAYLQSNRVDLDVVMEFRTGLRLAGVAPQAPPGVSTTNWFAENQDAMLTCAKSFCEISSGGKVLPVQSATVALVVEDHVELHVKYPAATERPLRFEAAGLKALAGLGQYGVALTVLDMVNGKVLGQPVLFADAPTLAVEIPAPAEAEMISPRPVVTATATTIGTSPPVGLDSKIPEAKTTGNLIVRGLISGMAALLLLGVVWRRNRNRS